jgi:superfamily I DNA/RNA helicase
MKQRLKAFAVYGSPGTGKTTELMRRIDDLRARGYAAEDIGFLSHTKAAAAEALERLGLKNSDKVSTIHSLCFRLLELSRGMVIDHARMREFAQSIGVPMRGGTIDDSEQVEVGDEYLGIYNLAIVTFADQHAVFDRAQCTGSWKQYEFFVERYEAWKHKKGMIDFNDMLRRYVTHPRPHGARVLLVDEAQDLSPLQWQVINTLLQWAIEEVHIAGDDDQAIYVWGGANPHGMVEFEQLHKAERLVLPQSHRIPRTVHTLAQSVIHRVSNRVEKVYAPRDEPGTLREHASHNDVHLNGDSTLILVRTGARKKEVERHLMNLCIPYLTEGGFPGPLQNRTARALRAHHTLRDTGSVSKDELAVLAMEGDDRTKKLIASKDLAALAARRDVDAVNVTPWKERYYSSVDVDVKPNLKLMTIHASKGREADRVVIDTALTQRVVSGMVDDPDSEARVFYVGITRARHRLDIVHGDNGYDL